MTRYPVLSLSTVEYVHQTDTVSPQNIGIRERFSDIESVQRGGRSWVPATVHR